MVVEEIRMGASKNTVQPLTKESDNSKTKEIIDTIVMEFNFSVAKKYKINSRFAIV